MNNIKNWDNKIKEVFSELKDFQKSTVEFTFKKLEKNNRFLVADEVGLGKTKIAKGIIAKYLQKYTQKNRKSPFQVYYICSNQALAKQNLEDLNIFKDDRFINEEHNRLVYLALKNDYTEKFSLSSLTPSTSFRHTTGTGQENERKLLYIILSKYSTFKKNKAINKGLKWLLIGNVGNWNSWKERINEYESKFSKKIIKNIPNKFVKKLRETIVEEKTLSYYDYTILQNLKKEFSYFDLLKAYSKEFQNKRSYNLLKKEFLNRNSILAPLRRILIEVCLENLKADLFILDEFQKFKDLVGFGNKENEASKLAQKIFNIEGAKCLMLSATPFKIYTSKFDESENEDHYAELRDLLRFLYHGNEKTIEEFEFYRKKYFEVLKTLKGADSNTLEIKHKLEKLYTDVMSRTERLIVSSNKDNMVESRVDNLLAASKEDITNFLKTDFLFQSYLKEFNKDPKFSLNYSKSVPFPLSFMDGYKAKKELNSVIKYNQDWFKKVNRHSKKAWINLQDIQNYKLTESIPNAKYRYLQNECFKDGMENILWLPPSLSYYENKGVFKGKKVLSKILIFSKWVMVPKMISSLLSYEVEKKTTNNHLFFPKRQKYTGKTKINKEGKNIVEPRKPLPILKLGSKASTLRSFTLLYPSQYLKNSINLKENLLHKKSFLELRESLELDFKNKIEKHKKNLKYSETGDKDWYWAAAILLDYYEYDQSDFVHWFEALDKHPISKSKLGSKINKASSEHLSAIKNFYYSIENNFTLGDIPKDLYKVLAEMAMASPAITINRSLENHFKEESFIEKMNSSLQIAYDFLTFFDKPEAISVVKINEEKKDGRKKANKESKDIYWYQVLRYCIDGNFQAMLDEYSHMLFSKNKILKNFTRFFSDSLNLQTSTIKVEGLKNTNVIGSKNMRTHFAVSFGNQKLETEKGQNRATDIIVNFNSPFRPFVLASTSIGQEGLDFHYYCRKIMHWNLPYSPIELEQREGRINRFKGLVIRQNIADKYKNFITNFENDIWDEMFLQAEKIESKQANKPELLPYWYTETRNSIKIERIVPLILFSKEIERYSDLITVLALYRLTFGQPNQEELLKTFKTIDWNKRDIDDVYEKYLFQLSPIMFKKTKV